jgi:hypothetical protein
VKKLIVLLVLLVSASVGAIDFKATTDVVGLSAQVLDSAGVSYLTPDSVYVVTTFHGLPCLAAWYNAGDAEADSAGGILTWYDLVSDIDADSGAGLYTVTAKFFNASDSVYVNRYYEFYLGTQSVNVASVSDDALNLRTDVTDVLPDSNVAAITVAAVDISAGGIATLATTEFITATSIGAGAITNLQLDGTAAAEIRDSSWTRTARTLTALDEDNTTIDINNTALKVSDFWNYDLANWGDSAATKAGHLVRTGCDTSEYGYIDEWVNIPQALVDTSEMGAWLVANVGTATSNWSDAQRDTLLAIAKTIDDTIPVNVVRISDDATADDSLEVMLDGTATFGLKLGRLAISGANSTNGSFYVNNSSGVGAIFGGTTSGATFTGSAGNGATFAGGTNGHGAAFTGAGTGDGLALQGGSGTGGHGMNILGGGASGAGIYALGSGSGSGFDIYGGSTANGVNISGGGGATNDGLSITGTDDGIVAQGGTGNGLDVQGSVISGTSLDVNTTFDSANFAGETFDSAHFTDKFFTNAQGAASGLDSTKVWGAAKQALSQGDFIWRANQFIIKTDGAANDTGAFAVYNTSSNQTDGAMSLVANAGRALYGYSASAANGVIDLAGASGVTGPVVRVRQAGTGEAVREEITNTSNTNQVHEINHAGAGIGYYVTVDDTAAAVQYYNSSTLHDGTAGEAFSAKTESGDAVLFWAGQDYDVDANYGFHIEGSTYWHGRQNADAEPAFMLHSYNNGVPLYIWPDTGNYGMRISGDTAIYTTGPIHSTIDSVRGVGGGTGGGSDTATIRALFEDTTGGNTPVRVWVNDSVMNAVGLAHPATFYGPSGSGSGTGAYSVVIYAYDTSGTDQAVEGVKVTAQDGTGGTVAVDWTNNSGYVTFAMDAGAHTIIARKTGYLWPNKSLTVSGNIDSTRIEGYDIVLSDAGADCCNVYGYVFDRNDQPLAGVEVLANPISQYVGVDTSATKSKILAAIPITARTDTTGLFQLFLRKTGDFADSTKGFYNIVAQYNGSEVFTVKKFYVPSASYIDLGDTLLTRGR